MGIRFYFKLTPFGKYFLIEGENKSGKISRVFNPGLVSLSMNGSIIELPDPLVLHKSRSIDFRSIEPGLIVDIRDRLWRVDGVDQESDLI